MWIATLALTQLAGFAIGVLGPWRDAPEARTNGRVARPIRMAISLSLVLAALLIVFRSDGITRVYAGWVLLGMSASFLGDLVMARLIPVPNRLIGGMLAFGVGHGFYIEGYANTLAAAAEPLISWGLLIGLLGYGAITVIGWGRFIQNPAKPRALNLAALAYGGWIAVMASFALALALALGGAWWLAALGGAVFIASDFLIGMSEIRGLRIANVNDWIWLTYIAGQMGIIYSGALAAGL